MFNSRWREIQLSYIGLNVIDLSSWLIVQLANLTIWFIVTYVTISLHKWVKYSNQKEEEEEKKNMKKKKQKVQAIYWHLKTQPSNN